MPVDFTAFAASVAATAAGTLNHVEGLMKPEGGDAESPETGEGQVQSGLATASQLIDTLVMLEEKTKGNLSESEQQFLAGSLTELRVTYVRLMKQSQSAST
jgi:hypothetical protein